MNLTNEQIERLTEPYPRGWIIHYWEEVCMLAPQLDFQEKKEAFFYLLERLLREGKVTFDHPDKPELWGETPEVMLSYFKTHWPANVSAEDDIDLTTYFYRMPGVSWLGPDGEWHGS
jgi:hypothetical protein